MRDLEAAAGFYRQFLEAMGLDDSFTDVEHSARRAAQLMGDWTSSVHRDEPVLSSFEAPEGESWIAIENIQFYSFCEHDLVPFFGTVGLAFLPGSKIAGFGGFARLVDYYSRKPQLQERLTQEIANAIDLDLEPRALLLRLTSRQLCLEMRGRGAGIMCTTYAERGLCATNAGVRQLAQTRLTQNHHVG